MDPLAETRKGTKLGEGDNVKSESYFSVLLRCRQQEGGHPVGVVGHRQKQKGGDRGVNGSFIAQPTLMVPKETLP